MGKTRVNIGRLGTNRTIAFIQGGISKIQSKNDARAVEILALSCSELSDNKTTYVQKKEWIKEIDNYRYPPYVDCDYVL